MKHLFLIFSLSLIFCSFVFAEWTFQTEPLQFVPAGEPSVLTVPDQTSQEPAVQTASFSFPESNPDGDMIQELARQLQNDERLIYYYVYNRIKTEPCFVLRRSPERTLLDGSGTPPEQAHLFSELIRSARGSQAATGFAYGIWTVPVQSESEIDICDLTGIGNYTNAYDALYKGGMIYSAPDPLLPESSVVVYRFYTGVDSVTNGWHYYDPSFKAHTLGGISDFTSPMNYSRSELLSDAGGTSGSGWVSGLDGSAVSNRLNQYAADLLASIRSNSVPFAETGRIIRENPEEEIFSLSGSASSITHPSGALPATVIPQLRISGPGFSTLSLFPYETAHRKISVRFTTNGTFQAQVYVDDELKRTDSIGGSYGDAYALSVDVLFQGQTNSAAYNLLRGGSYVLVQSFGTGCSGGLSGHISKNITALKRQGFADSSPEVFTESLRYTGQRWADQWISTIELKRVQTGAEYTALYGFGIMAGEADGFYIDIKNSIVLGNYFNSALDFADSYIGSALEHAVLEQLQPGNAKGVSTIRILTQANAENMPIYRADSNNWNSIKGSLNGYDKTAIQSDIVNNGAVYILPQSDSVTIDEWSGEGYVLYKQNAYQSTMSMMISGGYDGGYNAWKNPYVPQIQQTYTKPVYIPPIKTYTPPKSFDPVDMQTGAFLFDHDDLTLSGPLPLSLHRSYRSDSTEENGMGFGWAHSFNIRAAEHSAIDQSFGQRSAEDMVPYLVGASVVQDLLDNESTAKDWMVAALVADWTVEQLTQNAVSIYLGSKVLTFVKQPDGSYTPPPGMTVSLSRTNGVYVMQERNANRYTFDANFNLAQIADPDGKTLTFTYNAQTNLQTVVSSFGSSLTFNYTGNLLTSVSDNSSPVRVVQYQYDTGNNLTNFVDAAGKNWGIAYDDTNHPHAITSLTDPEEIVTIQNVYNDFGQVTHQVSATEQSYDLFITDYISIEQNPLGQRTTYFYDDKGRTVRTQRADGNSQYAQHDGWDRVTNTVDYAGVTNAFVYDTQNNLLSKTVALGTPEEVTTGYGYDSSNHLRFVTNALGTAEQTVTETTYTGTHHIDTVTEAKGTADERVTDFDWYSNGLLQQKSEGNGLRVTGYTYDGQGNPDTVTSTGAGTVDLDYDIRGNLIKQKDAKNAETQFVYDNRGLLLKTIYPDGSSVSNRYNGAGLLIAQTDAKGQTVSNVWNNAYKLQSVHYPDSGTVSNTYDAADRLIATKNTKNTTTTYQLDSLGRVTNQQSAIINRQFSYDVSGNLTNSVIDPSGLNLWTSTAYDSLNRPTSASSALSAVHSQYGVLGRQTNRIDAASKHWGSEYDALGRKSESLRPSGATEQFVYDALGNRIGFYNAEGKPITFGFDAQGRMTAITNAINKVTAFAYDANGNLVQRTDAGGQTIGYQYDAQNQLTNVVYESVWKASFGYDENGNIKVASNQNATVNFSYDEMNRLSGTVSALSSLSSFAVTNSYDLNGNRTNILYPGGLVVSYSYDAEDRLTSVTAKNTEITKTFAFGYDGASRLTNIAYPNGVTGSFDYDAESRITGYGYDGSSNFVSRSIVRDARGFKIGENIFQGLEPSCPEGEQRFVHDDADRLTRTTQRDTWLGGELNQWYNREYGYDDNGCLTQEYVSRELWNTNSAIDEYRNDYSWDYDSRLAGAEKTVLVPHDEIDGMTGAVMNRTYTDGPSTSTEYIYDASGVRIGRVHNTVTNWFVIDYNAPLKMPLAETDADGNVTRYYIWSSRGLLAHLDISPATGTITVIRYYHTDEQGSTLALTDENGDVTDQFAYTPYGGVTHTGSTETPYCWLGGLAVRAEGNGLYYMLNRYYSADMRRFISTDKKGIDGGANLYMYAGLNPNHYTDPFGLEKTSVLGNAWSGVKSFFSDPTPIGQSSYYSSISGIAINGNPNSGATMGQLNSEVASLAVGMALTGIGSWVDDVLHAPKSADEFVDVYRVFGDDARAQGFSWTTKDPRTISNFRDAAGLPSGGASGANNSAEFLIQGRARVIDIIESRPALPLDGNSGGLPELIIDPKNVNLIDFSILKP